VTVYATPDDLAALSLPGAVVAAIPNESRLQALAAAAALADSYLASRYRLPLVAWGRELTQAVCDIAAFYAMKRLGFNPDGGADAELVAGRDRAEAWLARVASGAVTPSITDTAPAPSGAGRVAGNPARGW
jgi:phage gp36-like protein